MTRDVVKVSLDDSAYKAAKKMSSSNVGTVIITDGSNDKAIGVITDRKLTTDVIAAQRDPYTTSLRELSASSPYTAKEDSEICDVLQMMANHELRRVPVVDNQERVIGVLSVADVAKDHAKNCGRCSDNILTITSKYA